jgi:hypothetical protein
VKGCRCALASRATSSSGEELPSTVSLNSLWHLLPMAQGTCFLS